MNLLWWYHIFTSLKVRHHPTAFKRVQLIQCPKCAVIKRVSILKTQESSNCSRNDLEKSHPSEPIELTAFRKRVAQEAPQGHNHPGTVTVTVCGKCLSISAHTSNFQQLPAPYTVYRNSNYNRCADGFLYWNGNCPARHCARSDQLSG